MILFKKLRYKNFLSSGNAFIEFNFLKHPTTLIIGKNGDGKSTLCDAISFALYGKAYRNINKPQLLNSITKKDLLVEIEFSIGSTNYLIRRGIAPAIFQIYINDNLVPEHDEILEYQKYLETNILKLTHKSFCQIIILGSANFTPFMQLTAADRRHIIEDLLDIQIFSTMNSLLKDKISSNKDETTKNEYDIKLLDQKKSMLLKNENMIKQNAEELIAKKQAFIAEYNEKLEEKKSENDQLYENVKANTNVLDIKQQLNNKKQKLLEAERTIEKSLRSIKNQKIFFDDHEHCPVCSQDIDSDFRNKMITEKETEVNQHIEGLSKIGKQIKSLNANDEKNQKSVEEIEKWRRQIQTNSIEMKSLKLAIELAEKEIESLKISVPVVDDTEIKVVETQLETSIKHKYTIAEQRRIYDIAALLLKDSGIKAKLIKQYVPIINKMANKYLASLDFFVNFELDEKFNEKIKSRYRDEFSYASFSEGEKMRIDFALLFTWRAVAKLRNSVSTNLLILDEVFDSSLDATGVEEFLKMLTEESKAANIFVISHKGDTMFDKFSNTIRFEKRKNFSRMV